MIDGVVATNSACGAYSQFNGYDETHPLELYLAHISLDNTSQSSSKQNAIPILPEVSGLRARADLGAFWQHLASSGAARRACRHLRFGFIRAIVAFQTRFA